MAPWRTWDVMQRKRREAVVLNQLSRWIKHFRANHFSFNLDFLNRFEFLTKRLKHYVVVIFCAEVVLPVRLETDGKITER